MAGARVFAAFLLMAAGSGCAQGATKKNVEDPDPGGDRHDAGGKGHHDAGAGDGDGDMQGPGDGDMQAKPDAGTSEPGDAGHDAGQVPQDPIELPFALDDHFVASGFMGDVEVDPASVTMIPSATQTDKTCNGDRALVTAHGICHQAIYKPTTKTGAKGWGGVYWQAHADDWGAMPGIAIKPGAKSVSFYAKGKVGGEVVIIGAGGLGMGGSTKYKDDWAKEAKLTLTTSWTPYSIDLTGVTYTTVLGGLRWTAASLDNASGLTFFIDDIEWK
jgi:hypothetical protein